MSMDAKDRSFASASLVFFQHTFMADLFFQNTSAIRPQFRFLTTRHCLGDLLAVAGTDLNLYDGRFWDHADPSEQLLETAIPGFRTPDESTYDDNILYRLRSCRSDSCLKKYGASRSGLLAVFHPNPSISDAPFIPFLGQLKICRNAIQNIKRSETFHATAPFLSCATRSPTIRSSTDDQSLLHFPLAIEPKQPIRFMLARSDREALGDLKITPKYRLHLCPYGLITIFLILNISAKRIRSSWLVSLQNQCLKREKSSYTALISYGKAYSGSVQGFFDWSVNLITRSVVPRAEGDRVIRGDCCVTTVLTRPSANLSRRERIGLLARESRWAELTANYLARHVSIFGRFEGEFIHASSNSLLLSLGELESKWKRKSRPRFRWNFIHIFSLLSGRKLILDTLNTLSTGKHSQAGYAERERLRIRAWLDIADKWHRTLLPPHRKYFYEVGKVLRVQDSRNRLEVALTRLHQTRSDYLNEMSLDFITSSIANIHLMLSQHQFDKEEVGQDELDTVAERIHGTVLRGLEYLDGMRKTLAKMVAERLGQGVYRALEEESRRSLVSAEMLLSLAGQADDCSASAIEFAKAAEIELNMKLVPALLRLSQTKRRQSHFMAGSKKIGPHNKHHLTLGEAPYLFAASWRGERSNRAYSNSHFLPWADDFFLEMLGRDFRDRLSLLASGIQTIAECRNEAAHVGGVDRMAALAMRQWWAGSKEMHALILGIAGTYTPMSKEDSNP